MDYEQLQRYKKTLLGRALSEGIKKNSEQTKIWTDYKERHEKVIESLEIFHKELTIDCIVPIGKRALMRGKLTHTNEILVSLGDGYFGKYSATQAIALCNRRIKRANEILSGLEKELDLLEMRQEIPDIYDAFGGEENKDLIEHWDDEKLDNWRAEHRQREKEYRKQLSELKQTEKKEIETEKDLFERLNALELQEELEDELHRLEAERPGFYDRDLEDGEDLEDSEVYEESESDSGSDTTDTESKEGLDEPASQINKEDSFKKSEENKAADYIEEACRQDKTNSVIDSCDPTCSKDRVLSVIPDDSFPSKVTEGQEKKIHFGKPHVKYFNGDVKVESISQPPSREKCESSSQGNTNDYTEDEENSKDDIIRIEFKHSGHESEVAETKGDSIESPRDVYKLLATPKSILKESSKLTPYRSSIENSTVDEINEDTDEEIDEDPSSSLLSAYHSVVKEIREQSVYAPPTNIEPSKKNERISKFKRERSALKKNKV